MRRSLAPLRKKMTIPVAALLAMAGFVPAVMLSGSAAAEGSGEEGAVAASMAVTAPNSFGQSADPVSEGPQAAASDDSAPDKEVLAYWTPERMAEAKPFESDQSSSAESPQAADAPEKGSGSSSSSTGPEGTVEPAQPENPSTSETRVNGKLFFNGYGEENAYCSASVVNTPSERVIITAGHCVYNSVSGWARNVVFVPDYDRNAEDPDPAGIWTARSLRTFDAWRDNGDFTHDVAFVTLNNGGDSNQPVAKAVGANGLAWGGSHDFQATVFGYPSNLDNPDGRYSMHTCEDTTFSSEIAGIGVMTSVDDCDFGPGASGGSWLYGYNKSEGVGYVRSLVSLWHARMGQNWSPYFTADVKTMMDATASD